MMEFKTILRLLLNREKMTQKELGTELYLSSQTVSAWVCGRTEPSISQLIDLSNVFSVTVGQLIGTEELEVSDECKK